MKIAGCELDDHGRVCKVRVRRDDRLCFNIDVVYIGDRRGFDAGGTRWVMSPLTDEFIEQLNAFCDRVEGKV